MKPNFTLPLGESDAVAAGEGPPQPLPRLTLVMKCAQHRNSCFELVLFNPPALVLIGNRLKRSQRLEPLDHRKQSVASLWTKVLIEAQLL